LSEMLLFAATN